MDTASALERAIERRTPPMAELYLESELVLSCFNLTLWCPPDSNLALNVVWDSLYIESIPAKYRKSYNIELCNMI